MQKDNVDGTPRTLLLGFCFHAKKFMSKYRVTHRYCPFLEIDLDFFKWPDFRVCLLFKLEEKFFCKSNRSISLPSEDLQC
jgi:hypothetical protein